MSKDLISELHASYAAKPADLSPGQIVRWKKGLKNRRFPRYDEPAVVVEILSKPVFDEEQKGAGSSYFQEPLELRLGILDPEDGDFVIFHFDRRRFEPIP